MVEPTIYKVGTDYNNTISQNAYEDSSYSSVGDFLNMDPEQRQKMEDYWKLELSKTEEEINTLRQVLTSKMKKASDLKRKLGITVWKEIKQDLGQGVKTIQETTAYQKTSEVVKGVGERTTSVFSSLGDTFRNKLGEVKNSNTFKSFEEKVGSTVNNVKSKMSGSRSNSMNFDEQLNSDRRNSHTATPATTPTINE